MTLQVKSLTFQYGDIPVLSHIRWVLTAGRLMHVRGANGAGKTTMLRLLAGMLQPRRGDIRWHGQSIYADLPSWQYQLCYAGHKNGLSPELTVAENCQCDWHWQRKKVSLPELLQQAGLLEFADIPCHHLSQGQQRRVSLVRLLMTDARVWLLDEPFVALDDVFVPVLADWLSCHLAIGGLIVMTSHQGLPQILQPKTEEYVL